MYWFPTEFPYRMTFASFNSNTTGVTNGLIDFFDFWCLMPLSAIFQLYHGDQF